MSEEKQRKEQGGSWVSWALHHVSKSSRICLWPVGWQALGHCQSSRFDHVARGGQAGIRSGDSSGSSGDTHKVPRDQQPGHSPEPPFGCLLLPPACRTHSVSQRNVTTLCGHSLGAQDSLGQALCSAVLLTCHQRVSSATQPLCAWGAAPPGHSSGEAGMKDGNPPPTCAQEQS